MKNQEEIRAKARNIQKRLTEYLERDTRQSGQIQMMEERDGMHGYAFQQLPFLLRSLEDLLQENRQLKRRVIHSELRREQKP